MRPALTDVDDVDRVGVTAPTYGDGRTIPPVSEWLNDESDDSDPVGEADGSPTGPGSLAERVRRPQTLISFAVAAAILWFFFRRLDIEPAAVWANVRQANPGIYALGFVAFYGSFLLRARRWRQMLGRVGIDSAHGYPMPSTLGIIEIFLLSWFANCVVPAKLGDAYRSYLLKRDTGASFSTTLGTILAERLIDLTVLFAAMSGMGLVVFGGHLPGKAAQAVIVGSALLGVGAVGVAVMWVSRAALERRLPARVRVQYARLHDAVFGCLKRPQTFLAVSVVIWLGEGLRLFLVAAALGADISVPTAIFVALMSSLLTTLPITPAGLGIVEGAVIVVLTLIGLDTPMAGSIALLDRVIGYWSIVAVGLVLYARRARREVA